jgi:hypothetical protein
MWDSVDQWWDVCVETRSLVGTTEMTQTLDSRWWAGLWEQMKPWWDASVNTHSLVQIDSQTATLDHRWQEGEWTNLDAWWDSFNEVRQADVADLRKVLNDCNQTWVQSESRFDEDPLATDWTRHQDTRGPLRPNQEENWSQWLAHLCRSSGGPFLRELFGEQFNKSPDRVQREAYLPDQGRSDRYADILIHVGDRGISIEVKKNDEDYGKTIHTTELIERQHAGEWHHLLLLPKYKKSALRAVFGDNLEFREDGSISLHPEESSPITVVYWRDVSQAIRAVLRDGSERNPHFEASAYLFCALIEQKLLQLTPEPLIEQIVTTDDVIHASRSLSVATGGTEEQLNYLREFEDEHDE